MRLVNPRHPRIGSKALALALRDCKAQAHVGIVGGTGGQLLDVPHWRDSASSAAGCLGLCAELFAADSSQKGLKRPSLLREQLS